MASGRDIFFFFPFTPSNEKKIRCEEFLTPCRKSHKKRYILYYVTLLYIKYCHGNWSHVHVCSLAFLDCCDKNWSAHQKWFYDKSFRKSNSLWFPEQVQIKMKMKTNVLINNNNNSTFIANNEMNSDLQQKGCTKVPKEIDLIFIKLPIKFSYIFFCYT